MPIRPLQLQASADNRLEPGCVVEYEQHNRALIGIILADRKGKWAVMNQSGGELELPPARLYRLPGRLPQGVTDQNGRAKFLDDTLKLAQKLTADVSLDEMWQVLSGEVREVSAKDLTELAFSSNTLAQHIAIRQLLLIDQVYFKRQMQGFSPRPPEVVEELKVKAAVEAERERMRLELVDAVVRRIKEPGSNHPIPAHISLLEDFAAEVKDSDRKETAALLEDVLARTGLSLGGRAPQKAFRVLVKAGHFSEDENLLLRRLGRQSHFVLAAIRESDALSALDQPFDLEGREDLTDAELFTIDAETTLDMDDALSIRRTDQGLEVGVHITDAASIIREGSALYEESKSRATSIYCPDMHLPMLPKSLSEGLLSLREGELRPAMSFYVTFDSAMQVVSRRASRSIVKSKAKLTYEQVDAVLCDEAPGANNPATPFQESLSQLWEIVSAREEGRLAAGALQFTRRDMYPRILPDGTVALEESAEDTPAHKLVSELMVLANETAALIARDHRAPLVFRGQDAPDVDLDAQGLDIPDGPARLFYRRSFLKRSTTGTAPQAHSGLGLEAYAQVTSPIRRFLDLINQAQISAVLLTGAPRYGREELEILMASAEAGLDEAQLIQRDRTRYFTLKYIAQERLKELPGIVVRLDGPKPLAEVEPMFNLQPFTPIKKPGSAGATLSLGDRIMLKIVDVDPRADVLHLSEQSSSKP